MINYSNQEFWDLLPIWKTNFDEFPFLHWLDESDKRFLLDCTPY